MRMMMALLIGIGLLVVPLRCGMADSTTIDPVKVIDSRMRQSWQEADIRPAQQAEDGEWCRRVYIDLIGRIPHVEELSAFLMDRQPNRRERLVARLTSAAEYADEFTRNWADYWTVLLIGRSEGQRDNLMSRQGLHQYLEQAIRENRPYDTMVRELITARGTSAPGTDRFNGAVNYLMLKVQDDAAAATSKTAQVFLGLRIQCMQCHDHPFNDSTRGQDWSQAQFWGLNSFFRQTVALRRFRPGSRRIDHGELADQDFAGEGTTPEEAEVYFYQRNGLARVAYPTFVDGSTLKNRSGYLSDVVRRQELAKLMRDSPLLEQALVNRLWGYFFGYGFTTPIDDFGPHNPPSHRDLLTELSAAFRASAFNLRELMKWIVLSEPYALSSRGRRTQKSMEDPSTGQPPQFNRFYLRQMRPETLYNSLIVARYGEAAKQELFAPSEARARWLRQFVIATGNDEGIETSTFDGTIPQTLMMFNGELMRQATSLEEDTLLRAVVSNQDELPKKIESLFLAALSRRPKGIELRLAKQLMSARIESGRSAGARERQQTERVGSDYVAQTLQDLWWVILNSSEFILVH